VVSFDAGQTEAKRNLKPETEDIAVKKIPSPTTAFFVTFSARGRGISS
jgi:hypothetical protein